MLLALVVAIYVSVDFKAGAEPDAIYRGPGVTDVRPLSDWYAPLAGGPGDTDVFILDSGVPGATVLVLGGTHPDEFAGFMGAVLLAENAIVDAGRLIVIPQANASGFTHNLPGEGHPRHIEFDTDGGVRRFRFGARATNPIHQWPDPEVYVQASGQELSGSETRNLNRAYPGRPDGNLTEQVAYAIMQLLEQENVTLGFDLHEASPEYPVINAIVAHPRNMELAVMAAMDLELEGVPIGVEQSPEGLRGLTHREWGDHTDTLPALFESANPVQGRLRGRTDADLVLKGKDIQYERAAKLGHLYVPFDEHGHPLEERVARHLATLNAFWELYGLFYPEQPLAIRGLPDYDELTAGTVGSYLLPPQ